MTAYLDSTTTSHIDAATLDALLTAHGAGAPETARFSSGQRPFASITERDAAQLAILAAHPRPEYRQGLSVRDALLTSGERPEDY